MTPKSVIFLFFFVCHFAVHCAEKKSFRIAGFFNENRPDFPINWNVINDTLDRDIAIYYPDITWIKEGESLEALTAICNSLSQEEPLLAVFSVTDECVSSTLASVCAHFNIPYITVSPKTDKFKETTFNLYPEAGLTSQGLAKIVQSLDWKSFIILYENEDGLLKLQDVIKLQVFSSKMKGSENFMVRKLEDQWDNRHLLKSLKNETIRRIILDCHVDRVMDILQQAKEINILSDISTSVLVTSLDAHTLDFSNLNVLANITIVRLFSLNDKNFKETVKNYFPDHFPDKIRVEPALFHDSLLLFATAANSLRYSDLESIENKRLTCESPEKLEERLPFIHKLQQVIVSDSLTGEISLKNGIRDKFTLEVFEVDNPEKPIGIWYSEAPEKVYLTRNATEREAELQKRLSSHNFIVTSKIGAPYLMENKDPNAVGNARYFGYSMDLIGEIAKLMNITFEFRITEGKNPYTKLVNDLIERRADLGICDFTINPSRQEAIDFSMPFMNLGIGILHIKKNQTEANQAYAFVNPYAPKVWFYTWTLNLVISVVMFVVARLAPNEWEPAKPWDENPEELENIWDLKNFLWLTLGSITTQGCDILPKAFSTRVISAFWWFFSLIITSSYTANLAAFLTSEKIDVVIDTVEELAAQTVVKYGVVEFGSTYGFFANSNNSLYQKLWNNMVNEKPSVFVKDNEEGVDMVMRTKDAKFAFFMESTGIEYMTERKCPLRRIGNLLDSKSYGIGMPMNADYRHKINAAVLKLQESGKLAQLKEKWWKKMKVEKPCPPDEVESASLGLENIGGIFVVLGVGIGVAYMVAIVQFLWNVRKISVEENMPYNEVLKIELKFACNFFEKKKRVMSTASKSSSTKSLSVTKSTEKLASRKSISQLSVPTIAPNEVDHNLRKRSHTQL